MSEVRAIGSDTPTNRTLTFTAFAFFAVSYLTLLFTILYAVGFVSDAVPKAIDSGTKTPLSEAVAISLALVSLVVLQQSRMARRELKQRWTRFIPRPIERGTPFLFASLTLLLLFWKWRPMPTVVWFVGQPEMVATGATLALGGWVLVRSATSINSSGDEYRRYRERVSTLLPWRKRI